MTAPPTSLKVLVLPQERRSKFRHETVQTVATEIKPFVQEPHFDLYSSIMTEDAKEAAESHLVTCPGVTGPQPKVARLPNTIQHWKIEGWEKRVAHGTTKHHVFFTRSRRGLIVKRHLGYQVSGDVFILKLSDTKDENGLRFYVDMEDNLEHEELLELVMRVTLDPKTFEER